MRGAVSHVSTRADLATSYQFGDHFEVEAQRLDQVGPTGQRMVLKIDVEGQELAVLRGGEALFAQRRVLAVFIDGYDNAAEAAEFLRRRVFVFFDARTLQPADALPYALLAIHQELFTQRHDPQPPPSPRSPT